MDTYPSQQCEWMYINVPDNFYTEVLYSKLLKIFLLSLFRLFSLQISTLSLLCSSSEHSCLWKSTFFFELLSKAWRKPWSECFAHVTILGESAAECWIYRIGRAFPFFQYEVFQAHCFTSSKSCAKIISDIFKFVNINILVYYKIKLCEKVLHHHLRLSNE